MRVALVVLAALVLAPAATADRGRDLYFANCVWCHGDRLQGVPETDHGTGPGAQRAGGPALRGVGAQAADLYLRTGYMPLRDPEQQPEHTHPHFRPADLDALVAFVASYGGPKVPHVDPARGNLATGLQVFTEHCAGCHQVVAQGGIVTGAWVPALDKSTATEVAEAVRVGPYVMPRFDEHQISQHELDSLARYVLYARNPHDRGGWAIGRLGPFPEGAVAWLIAGISLLAVARVIGEGLKR